MDRIELLKLMQESRAELDAALAGLSEAQMVDPGVMDDWSVKDILAHFTAWEAEAVTLLAQARAGKQPRAVHSAQEIDDLNARWHKENKHRSLERVLADHAGVRKQMLRQLAGCSDQDLNQPRPWLKGKALVEWVKTDTFEHEAEHLAHIREWKQRKLGT